MNLLLNIATRGRARALTELISNIKETISGKHPYKILIKIDTDDQSYNINNLNAWFPEVEILRTQPISKIFATNHAVELYDWEIVLNVSDDMRFVKRHWDVTMITQIRSIWPEGTDFYPAYNDSFVRHKLATMDIKGREYYERDMNIYHPSYKSVSCDAENLHVAMMRGRHHYFPEVLFKHQHPVNTRVGKIDETYRNNGKYDKEDTANYFKRLAANFHIEGDFKASMDKLESYGSGK